MLGIEINGSSFKPLRNATFLTLTSFGHNCCIQMGVTSKDTNAELTLLQASHVMCVRASIQLGK